MEEMNPANYIAQFLTDGISRFDLQMMSDTDKIHGIFNILDFALSNYRRHEDDVAPEDFDMICKFETLVDSYKNLIFPTFPQEEDDDCEYWRERFTSDEDPTMLKNMLFNLEFYNNNIHNPQHDREGLANLIDSLRCHLPL